MREYNKGDKVTLDIDSGASNVFVVQKLEKDEVLLNHPLYPEVYIKVSKNKLNMVPPSLKDTSERLLDYTKANKDFLDFDMRIDLKAMSMVFVVSRRLTSSQKRRLSMMLGTISSKVFNNDIEKAIRFINQNHQLFDSFNSMWYENLKFIFSSPQSIVPKKNRATIFNMAGALLAELENPKVENGKAV